MTWKRSMRANCSRRDPANLAAAEAGFFPSRRQDRVRRDANLARLSLWLATRQPSYAGEIAVDAAVQGKSLHQTFIFRCTPQGAPGAGCYQLFACGASALHWTLVGGNAGQFRQAFDRRNGRIAAGGGESWELNLRLPRQRSI